VILFPVGAGDIAGLSVVHESFVVQTAEIFATGLGDQAFGGVSVAATAAVGVEEYRCDNDGDNGDGNEPELFPVLCCRDKRPPQT